MGVSTRDSGPASPVKRFGIRPGSGATPPDESGSTPRVGSARSSTGPVATVVTRPAEEAHDPISRLRRSFAGIIAEIRKITWPTRQEATNLTIVVIGLAAFVGVTLGLLDATLAEVVKFLTTGIW